MSFISFTFLVFILILLLMYFCVPAHMQWCVILIFNIIFYLSYGAEYIGFIGITAIVTWGMALMLERTESRYDDLKQKCEDKEERKKLNKEKIHKKKGIMVLGLAVCFGIWGVFKYAATFLLGVNRVTGILGKEWNCEIPSYVLPLGISFYTFIAASYCIDIYRQKYKSEHNFFRYFTFVSFFPHLIQGPFSRYDHLSKSLYETHTFDYRRMGEGIVRIVWGLIKKMVIADRLSIVIDRICQQDQELGGIYIIVLIVLLPVRLYTDFSGYMDMGIGICRIMGISLQENFRQPVFAKSVDEFWRRWHITLGAWFRDYLFYPVSMSGWVKKVTKRLKQKVSPELHRMLPSYIALFFVWSATGLWHGGAFNYLLWGWINLLCIASGMLFKEKYKAIKKKLHIRDTSRLWQGIQMTRTFLIFGVTEMLSDASSFSEFCREIKRLLMVSNWGIVKTPLALLPGLEGEDVCIVVALLAIVVIIDILKEKKADIYGMLHQIPIIPRYICYVAMVYVVILFGFSGGDVMGGFMYAQF